MAFKNEFPHSNKPAPESQKITLGPFRHRFCNKELEETGILLKKQIKKILKK
uniref:Uncharacterized protein n=1 Tax=Arundo donax TaxID=35708 RepID=A0A0A8Y9V6_ARUDO